MREFWKSAGIFLIVTMTTRGSVEEGSAARVLTICRMVLQHELSSVPCSFQSPRSTYISEKPAINFLSLEYSTIYEQSIFENGLHMN